MANIKEAKVAYAERMNELLDNHSKILFCLMDNVRSQQVHDVRIALRGRATLLMGKKTMQKRILQIRADRDDASKNDTAMAQKLYKEDLLVGNLGLLFTNESPAAISDILNKHRIQAPARIGAVAPCEVIVPAGNTGLEPTMTSFFQALSIPTKINKGTVEITADKKVLSEGDKVDNSTAVLLKKLKISPFWYQMEVVSVWDSGMMFSKDDLKVTDASLESAFFQGISNITALSLGAGVPTEASFPHMLMDAFKNLLAVSIETDYAFPEYNGEQLRKDAKAGKLGGGAAPAAAAAPSAAAAPAAAAKVAAPVEEEEEIEEMDLF